MVDWRWSQLTLLSDGSPYIVTFLRFDLSSVAGKTITAASLHIHTSGDADAGSNASFNIEFVQSNTWSGAAMSMNNSTPISSTWLGALVAPSQPNSWYQASLSPGVLQAHTGGLLSMAIIDYNSSDGLIFYSKEGDPAVAPVLVVNYQ